MNILDRTDKHLASLSTERTPVSGPVSAGSVVGVPFASVVLIARVFSYVDKVSDDIAAIHPNQTDAYRLILI